MVKKRGPKQVLISTHLTKQMLDEMDELVGRGVFPSRSELIRFAVATMLSKYSVEPVQAPPRDEPRERVSIQEIIRREKRRSELEQQVEELLKALGLSSSAANELGVD